MRTRAIITSAAVLTAALGLAFPVGADPKKDDVATVVKGNNEFAFDLYGQLRQKDGNVFFSPASLSTALAMTYAGARGQTQSEMAKTLHATLPPDRFHAAYAELLRQWNHSSSKCGPELSIASALWVQKDSREHIKDAFLKLARDDYNAEAREMTFLFADEGVHKEINAWVEKQTHGRIKDISPRITDYTVMVLTSASYFKGDWASRFPKDQTRDEAFTAGRVKVTVPMMHQTAQFKYLDAGQFQMIEMPYAGKDLSMVVLLPKKADGLAEMEKSLSAKKLACLLCGMDEQQVKVSLPRFKTAAEYDLNEPLKTLGMKSAFYLADFSGITDSYRLRITDVQHKAVVEVNEEGTEAASSSAVVLDKDMAEFRADHPFVFLIRDTRSDSILFLGRIVNPTK